MAHRLYLFQWKNPTKFQLAIFAKRSTAFKLVLRCLENNICELFQGCFELQQHEKTRKSKLDKVPGDQNRVSPSSSCVPDL